MVDIEKVKEIINGRPVIIFLHGKSLETIENRIIELQKYDLCYTTIGFYSIIEKYLLSKLNRKLDILADYASVALSLRANYEINVRLPRITDFLKRQEHNLWITTHGLLRDAIFAFKQDFIVNTYGNKIFLLDNIFPEDNRHWHMSVPNSLTMLLAVLINAGVNKIVLFGFDGYRGASNCAMNSYYKTEEQLSERMTACGTSSNDGIERDTNNFELMFREKINYYENLFKHKSQIVNCSPNSLHNTFQKMTFDEVLYFLDK